MRRILIPLVLLLAVCLAACGGRRFSVGDDFATNFAPRFRPASFEVVDVVRHATPNGAKRMRAVGIYLDRQRESWHVVFADYGELKYDHWIAMEFPVAPIASYRTRAEALDRARAFVVESTTPPPAPLPATGPARTGSANP